MSKHKHSKDFAPQYLGSADFANGSRFTLVQVNARGAVRVTDKAGNASYARSYANAWANIRYQAGILFKTQRSSQK